MEEALQMVGRFGQHAARRWLDRTNSENMYEYVAARRH